MEFQPSAYEFGDNTCRFMLTFNSPSQLCAFVKLFPLLGAIPFCSNWGNAFHTSSLYINFSSSKACSHSSPLPASFKRDLLLQSCGCMPCLVISMAVSACIPSAIPIIPLQGTVCAPPTPMGHLVSYMCLSSEWRDICPNLLAPNTMPVKCMEGQERPQVHNLQLAPLFTPAISNPGKPLAHFCPPLRYPLIIKKVLCVSCSVVSNSL